MEVKEKEARQGKRVRGGERLMGAAAYGGGGFKERAAASGERPIGAASCRQEYNRASCHQPPPPSHQIPRPCANPPPPPSITTQSPGWSGLCCINRAFCCLRTALKGHPPGGWVLANLRRSPANRQQITAKCWRLHFVGSHHVTNCCRSIARR